MPAKVILNVIKGPLTGAKYRFDERMICLVGRAENCMLRLTDEAATGVSRLHCLLDVRPPQLFVCDLGSRNGTYINQTKLASSSKDDANNCTERAATYEIHDGDHIRIGKNIFAVSLQSVMHCRICGKEMPDSERGNSSDTRPIICPECQAKNQVPVNPSAKTVQFRQCAVCGQKVAESTSDDEIVGMPWEENHALFICRDCLINAPGSGKTFPIPAIEARGTSLLPIEDYRVLKRIGKGGMGVVYLAEDPETLEKVALKILQPELAAQEEHRQQFIREANHLKRLKHPNIVELKRCDYDGGALYIALEYCNRGTLREFMRHRQQPLPVSDAIDFTCQILDGLEYAHHVRFQQNSFWDDEVHEVNGIVHRDIKPENIFLSNQDGAFVVKIADFGIAKAFDMAGLSGCTMTGDFAGTLGFIPKQQFINYKYVKPEVDIWATAATLYYMLTLRPPRDFNTPSEVLRIFELQPVPIRRRNPEIPADLANLIDSALDDRENLKFRDATQFKLALLHL